MSDTSTPAVMGLPEAARRLGVPIRAVRRAIRAGTIPAPAHLNATVTLSAGWLETVQAAIAQSPKALSRATPQKVPPFARYKGTSAWRKYTNRVNEYARFLAKTHTR